MHRQLVACSTLALLLLLVLEAWSETPIKRQVEESRGYRPSSSLSRLAEPEGGEVSNGLYSNQYFQLVYPLPNGLEQDVAGPVPSATGYYMLSRLKTKLDFRGIVSIEAQDEFFDPSSSQTAMQFAQRRERQAAFFFRDIIDRPPQAVELARHRFARFDYSGAGFSHVDFSTVVRCHVLTIELTSRSPEILGDLEGSMSQIRLLEIPTPESGGGPVPVCIKDYATQNTVIHRVDPAMVGPRFTKVPTRFVIDRNGKVIHIHVINALPMQAKSVEDALSQWVFKPYRKDGQPVEVETGILFEFPPRSDKHNIASLSH